MVHSFLGGWAVKVAGNIMVSSVYNLEFQRHIT